MPVLLPVPCPEDIGRVCVDEHLFAVKPLDQLCCRTVLDLHAPQALCCLHDLFRVTAPVLRRIGTLPALYIVFPADFLAVCPEAVAHIEAGIEIYRPAKTVRWYRRKSILVNLSGIRCKIYLVRKALRVLFDPLKQVDYIPVEVIDRLDVAPGLTEEDCARAEKWLQITVMLRKIADDPVRDAPFASRVF